MPLLILTTIFVLFNIFSWIWILWRYHKKLNKLTDKVDWLELKLHEVCEKVGVSPTITKLCLTYTSGNVEDEKKCNCDVHDNCAYHQLKDIE
jgi:hypothetical protein